MFPSDSNDPNRAPTREDIPNVFSSDIKIFKSSFDAVRDMR